MFLQNKDLTWREAAFMVVAFFLCLASSGHGAGNQIRNDSRTVDFSELNHPLHLYGRVVDQNAKPVPGAVVVAGYFRYSKLKGIYPDTPSATAETDENGRFDIVGIKGRQLGVNSISKEGYEYLPSQNPHRHLEPEQEGQAVAHSSPDERIVFVLRRRINATYLLQHGSEISIEINGPEVQLNLVSGRAKRLFSTAEEAGAVAPEKLTDWDFSVSAGHDPATQEPILTFRGLQEGCGIAISEQILYEAPADVEYKDVLHVKLKRGVRQKFCVYFRSRRFPVYSRLALDVYRVNEEEVTAGYESALNPYGTKSLEFETRLSFDDRLKLKYAAEDALEAGRLPPAPDIGALLKAAGQD